MKQNELNFIFNVMELMNKVPQASPNPYDMTGWIHAARDYEKVHNLVSTTIKNYSTYVTWKNSKDVDEEYLEMCKEKYETCFEELKSFINKRVNEGWI